MPAITRLQSKMPPTSYTARKKYNNTNTQTPMTPHANMLFPACANPKIIQYITLTPKGEHGDTAIMSKLGV